MSVRSLLWGGAFAFVAIYPSTTLAQAPWIPPKGEADVAVTYQWLDSDRHLLSGLTGPELTPLEVAYGIDFQSNSLDVGRVQSHALVVDADVGLTGRLALSGSLTFVAPRYRGTFAEAVAPDNGAYHPSAQDAQVGARYMVANDVWAFTPFTSFTFPVTDYEVLAHAAHGLGLNMLEVGASVGRILLAGGAAKGYLQGTYGYAFTESPIEHVSLNRSRATLEAGFFFGRVAVQALTSWRRVHGGLEWSDVTFSSHEHFPGHDQSAATREWRYGAGVSFQLTEGMSVEGSLGDSIHGANTHDARTVTVGMSWGFQAFGGRTLGGGFK